MDSSHNSVPYSRYYPLLLWGFTLSQEQETKVDCCKTYMSDMKNKPSGEKQEIREKQSFTTKP